MKKVGTYVVCFVLIFALFVPIAALAFQVDEHNWAMMTDRRENVLQSNSSGHWTVTLIKWSCAAPYCSNSAWETTNKSAVSPHVRGTYLSNVGHLSGGRHAFRYRCSVCGTNFVYTKACSGPPCALPQ